MPPKARFSKEDIVDKAFDIVRERGADALTARYLGERLSSSARPIFTVFDSMDEVFDGVVDRAKSLYNEYVRCGLSSAMPFKGVGTQYILFAINEPKLFHLLFMTQCDGADVNAVLPMIDDNYISILQSIQDAYKLNEDDALRLYRHLWIYTHGIATLCATGTCTFDAQQISDMLTDVFIGVLSRIRSEK